MTIDVNDKPHARLGASGWHTWSVCPGSDVLGEGVPNTSSGYAKEGTAAHALLEKCLLEKAEPEEFLGEEIVVEGELFVVDHEMVNAIGATIEIVMGYKGPDGSLFAESEVPIDHLTGETGALGTCDVAVVSSDGTLLTIADLKYGQGVMVYASENDPEAVEKRPNGQLAMYASGWLQANGFMFEEIDRVRLVILQPRMEWHDEYEITIDQLRAFEDRVREAAGIVELERQQHLEGGAELTLVPGEKQCKFCNARSICPALRETATKALSIVADPSKVEEFEDLTLPKKAAAIVVNEGVSNERLAEFMRAIPLVEQAIAAAGEEAMRRLSAGQELSGFYLGVGRAGRRKWINEEHAREELTKSGRLKVSEATVAKVKSPTEIEKIAGKTRWFPKIAHLIEQSEGGPKICQEGVDRNARYQLASDVTEFHNLDGPVTITKVYDARTGNGLIVETSDNNTHVIATSWQTREVMKLAKVGAPLQPLLAALHPEPEPEFDPMSM